MPKFMKDKAIALLDAGIETYLLALYGLNVPSVRARRTQDIKFAPIMGLFGASTELLVKACLVQAKGLQSMYHDDDCKFSQDLQNPGRAYFLIRENVEKPGNWLKY